MDCLECNIIIQVKLDVDAKDASPAVAGTSASHPLKYRFELKWQKVHGLISRFYNVQYPFKLDRLMPAYMQPPKLPTAKQVALLHTWHQLAKSNPGRSIRELVALWSSWCTLAGTLYVLAPAHEPLWDSFVQGTWRSCPTTEVEEGQGLISRTTTKKCPQGEAGCSLFFPFPCFSKAHRTNEDPAETRNFRCTGTWTASVCGTFSSPSTWAFAYL